MKLVLLLAFGSFFMVACAAPDEIVAAKSPVTEVAAPAPANAAAPQPVASDPVASDAVAIDPVASNEK